MDEPFERQIESIAKPLLGRGRGGDWEHTIRAIAYARYLAEKLAMEKGVFDKHEMRITYNSKQGSIHQEGKGVSFKT